MPGQAGRRAFTLLELVIVILLIGVLAAFAWPDFQSSSKAKNLEESAGRMRALLTMCRAEAMNDACRYRIEIRPDGSLRVKRQVDPIVAPHVYNPVRADWAHTDVLLPDVWIAAIQLLPEGPPPIMIVDDELTLPEMEVEPVAIEEFEAPLHIDFEPDGACPSFRWVLREAGGRALLLTLDGRLGRVAIEEWEALSPDDVIRPEPWEQEEEEFYDVEEFENR